MCGLSETDDHSDDHNARARGGVSAWGVSTQLDEEKHCVLTKADGEEEGPLELHSELQPALRLRLHTQHPRPAMAVKMMLVGRRWGRERTMLMWSLSWPSSAK